MSEMHPLSGLPFNFGSTLTILTTAAAGIHRGKTQSSRGVFTGVVLDNRKFKFRRDSSRISVSVEAEYEDGVPCCKKECNHEKDYDQKEWQETKKETNHECHKHTKNSHNAYKDKSEYAEEHKSFEPDQKLESQGCEEYMVLSLTCSSYPFTPGQIVWISLDQIVAMTVVCRN